MPQKATKTKLTNVYLVSDPHEPIETTRWGVIPYRAWLHLQAGIMLARGRVVEIRTDQAGRVGLWANPVAA